MKRSVIETIREFDIFFVGFSFLLFAPVITVQRTNDFIIFCIFVLGYNLLYGFMGRLSFGHMLYLGVGAYASALTAEYLSTNPLVAIILALFAGAATGVILGPIIVRTTGACFALINLAFNQVGYFLALIAFAKWTGGEDGMAAFFDNIWILDLGNRYVVFGLSLFCLLLVVYLMRRLTDSPFGIVLRTIKENETRVRFLGYNVFRYKLAAFVISTTISAFAGALSIINYTYVTPSFIDTTRNVEVIFASLIGGSASIYGSLVGGVSYMIISNYLPKYIQQWEMFLGIALLLLVFRFRAGLWGYISDTVEKYASKEVRE
jgi:branched-chain amino acid transport system permease protein